jgi:hypothetical protein
MDNLFKALPRDLQWEILSEFVGTHVVRNGKLMRKLMLDITKDQAKYLARYRPCYDWLYNHHNDEDNKMLFARWFYNSFNDDDHIRTCAKFAGQNQIMFCRDIDTDETIYMYRKEIENQYFNDNWEAQFTPINVLDVSVVLPPFIKHEYPSYEYTDKKKRLLKQDV